MACRSPIICQMARWHLAYRIRTALVAKEGSRWSKGEGTIVPYGLGRLEEARKAGYLVLVEGESDCWTLWYHGFPALGLPGAEMARTLEESMLTGIDRLYLMQEPDAGGTAFVNQLTRKLEAWQWSGKAFVLRLEGAKDPNELHQQDRQGFRTAFQHALDQAEPLSSRSSQLGIVTILNRVSPRSSVCRTCCPGSYRRCAGPSQKSCRKD